jgi:hypothetical protein
MAAMGVLGGLSAAAVAAEPPPKLYIGDNVDPDGQIVERHRGEMMANDRLVRNAGDAIAQGNQTGRLPSSGPAQAVLAVDGRDFSSLLGHIAKQPGAFRDLLQEGQPPPGVKERTY